MPFEVIGTVALIVCGIIAYLMPPMQEHLDKQSTTLDWKSTITNITGDRNQVNALLAGFILVMAHFLIIPFISPYMIKNVGLTQLEISYQFFFGGAATIITSPIIGRLTDRYGVMKVFVVVMLLSYIPTLIITHLTVVPLAVALTYTTLFFIFGSGRMISPNTIITAAAPVDNRGSFMSIKSSLQQLAIALASYLSGALVYIGSDGLYHGYHWVGYSSIAFSVIAIYLVSKLKVAEGN